MTKFEKIESLEAIASMKQAYLDQAIAPLDGMWLMGFVPAATHYWIVVADERVGFFCVNDDGYLLQFFLLPEHEHRSASVFESIFTAPILAAPTLTAPGSVPTPPRGAFASTAEPVYLSACLEHLTAFKVHSVMFELNRHSSFRGMSLPEVDLVALDASQLSLAVEHGVASIGAPAAWLDGYFGNLIGRGELFGVLGDDGLRATGELRGYDSYQKEYADLGVIVAPGARGKGLASSVLTQLVTLSESKKLRPICSTEITNIGAQTAIRRAGFGAKNRIVQFDV